MGWTGVSNQPGASTLDMLKMHSSYYKGSVWWGVDTAGNRTRRKEITDIAMGTGGVYAILTVVDLATAKTYRTAVIILVQRKGGEFLWKEMSEAEGPNACGIPARLFNKLTPAQDFASGDTLDYIMEWRQRVHAHLSKKSRIHQPGDVLEFEHPLRFQLSKGNVVEVNLFKVRSWGREKRFDALCNDGTSFLCRLRRRVFESNYTVRT